MKESPEQNISMVKEALSRLEYQKEINGYTYRLARKADAYALAELYSIAFPEYPNREVQKKEYHENPPKDTVRLVSENQGIWGAAALKLNPPCLLAEIERMVVHPEARSKHIGTNLIRCCVEISEYIGLQKLYAHVRTRNPGAQKAFLKNGFIPVCLKPGHYLVYHNPPVRENMIYMELFLTGKEYIDEKNKIIPEIKEYLF